MGYRKVGYLEQIWYAIKYAFGSWYEWQVAKAWAKDVHPAWVEIAKRSKSEETRTAYRNKILNAYREDNLWLN